MKISIIGGTGYIGLVTGIGLANHKHDVICADIDKNKMDNLNKGILPIYESGLQDLYDCAVNNRRIHFTDCIKTAVAESDIIFIAVGTPENKYGDTDLSQLMKALKTIAGFLTNYKLIVLKSTVPVGTCQVAAHYIRQNTRDLSASFDIVSNPEFLREGSAVKDFMFPERIVIGADNQNAISIMKDLYSSFKAPIISTDLRSSEMIKYACNSYLASRISFINEIAEICEKVKADIHSVIEGMKLDKRIGGHYLSPGPGFGGPCLSKDLKSLINFSLRAHANVDFLKSVLGRNEIQLKKIYQSIKKELDLTNGKNVAIWGLSFKGGTDDIRNSPAVTLVEILINQNLHVSVYDPAVKKIPVQSFAQVRYADSMEEAATGADCLVIMTDWPEFKEINLNILSHLMAAQVIIDSRNILEPKKVRQWGFKYLGTGVPIEESLLDFEEECLEGIG